MASNYWELLKHPEWQKRRLHMLDAAGWECEKCGAKEKTLHVHHKQYIKGRKPWEYEDTQLAVLCEGCHEDAHLIGVELKESYFRQAAANLEQATKLTSDLFADAA